jgi:hypothetical protein
MKRILFVASVTFWILSPQLGDTCAAGPNDGEWSGTATAVPGRFQMKVYYTSKEKHPERATKQHVNDQPS